MKIKNERLKWGEDEVLAGKLRGLWGKIENKCWSKKRTEKEEGIGNKNEGVGRGAKNRKFGLGRVGGERRSSISCH